MTECSPRDRCRAMGWRASVVVAVVVLLSTVLFGAAGTASATEPQTLCSAYTDDQMWQTSAQWGRVRQRLCVEFTDAEVRAQVQFQTDWPAQCSLSAGLPPSVGIDCPANRLTKLGKLTFKDVVMPISWRSGQAPEQSASCRSRM